MSAGQWPITIEEGSTFSLNFTWLIDEEPVDLSGYTAKMQIRKNATPGAAIILEAITNPELDEGTITLSNEGVVDVKFTPTQTTGLKSGWFVYDIKLTASDLDEVYRILEGGVFISPQTTTEEVES